MKLLLLAAVLLASSFVVLASEHGARYTSVTIPLRLKNLPELERLFWAVSDPSTPEFGQFLTTEEIQRLTAPSHQQVQYVFRWLSTVGARHFELGASGDVIFASLPHTVAAALIAASHKSREQLARAVHTLTVSSTRPHGHTQHTSSSSSLSSAEVSQLIDLVVDTEAKGLLAKAHHRRWKKLRSVVKAADVSGDPVTQRKSYGIPADLRGTNPSNKQMVWGTGTFGYQNSDLSAFYAHFNINESVSSLSTLGYQGVPGGDNFGEGTLDTTYISTIGLGVPTIVANTDNSSSSEEGTGFGPALLNFVLNMSQSAQSDLPLVVSMSLGSLSWDSCNILCVQLSQQGQFGFDDCLNYLQNTQRQVCMYPSGEIEDRVNVEFMKLGLRGVTFVAATGDGGSHYSFGPFSSLDPMGPGLNNISCTLNFPTFPAASPYVLAVGGTAWDSDIFKPVAWSASGSGFSWRYPRPDYQKDIVSAYLADVTSRPGFPPAYAFNASNRAYPDVAALSVNIPMIEGGSLFSAGGTSASAPSFAGVISLLNDIRLNAGLGPLGFVNTRLYQLAAAHPNELFYPILSGTSACADDGSCCDTGFLASPTVPWNPLVGLGSPLFPGLVKYLTTA